MEVAWLQLKEDYPDLLENEKIEIIGYAPELAAMHRGIDDKTLIYETLKTVCRTLAEDLNRKDKGEPVFYSINFLLSYLESNTLFGYISESESEKIMDTYVKTMTLVIEHNKKHIPLTVVKLR